MKFISIPCACLVLLTLLLVSVFSTAKPNDSPKSKPKNILIFMAFGSYSMRISIWPLVEALAEEGHHVTFISSHPSKNPNPKVFDFVPKNISEFIGKLEKEDLNFIEERRKGNNLAFWFDMPSLGIEVCKQIMHDPDVLKWLKTAKYDLVFVDSFLNECGYGLAHAFNAKTIMFSTTSHIAWFYDAFGIPDDSSWAVADFGVGLPVREMSFLQRTINAVLPVFWKLIREVWYFPKLEEISKTGLGVKSMPSFSEIEKNISLVFVTNHYSQEFARAYTPNVVSVGGLGVVGKKEKLPKEIESFIEKGKDGFVYISFGTIAEFANLDKPTRNEFIKGLLQFPNVRYIWKSGKDIGVDLPENFLVLKWAPQQALLAHPKIKAFVTHAGLGGINEAIYYGVPMITFPIFSEQDNNAALVEAKGVAIKMEILTVTADKMQSAVNQVINSNKMKEKMQVVSELFRNRPKSALETALWWTEFVLETDAGEIAEFLRPPSTTQSWWVRRQLDVWLFIGVVFAISGLFTVYIMKLTLCSIKRKVL